MSKSRNDKFHRLFKCVPEEEHLYNSTFSPFVWGTFLDEELQLLLNDFKALMCSKNIAQTLKLPDK